MGYTIESNGEPLVELGAASECTRGIPEEHMWENFVTPEARDAD